GPCALLNVQRGERSSRDNASIFEPLNQYTFWAVCVVASTPAGGSAARSPAGTSRGYAARWVPSPLYVTRSFWSGSTTAVRSPDIAITRARLPASTELKLTCGSSSFSGVALYTVRRSAGSPGHRSITPTLPDAAATVPYVQPVRGCLPALTSAGTWP